MTLPREVIRRKIRQWTVYADEDLRLAEYALGMPEPRPYRLIAYHAQQCAEKYLKAYLLSRGIDFPFTHNISVLLELAEPVAKWPQTVVEAERLTAYAMTTRYAGVEETVDETEAREALQITRHVRETLRQDLPG